MSNTRHASDGERLSQERFCSSEDYEQGLLANLVARRCELLTDPSEAELLFFLQYHSHQPGGLKKFVRDLLAAFPERVATRTMQKLGLKDGQIYTPEQVEKVRDEHGAMYGDFPLNGEYDLENETYHIGKPKTYPVKAFLDRCLKEAQTLDALLMRFCLDPEQALTGPWYFPTLIETLADYQTQLAQCARASLAETEISRLVFEALDYALEGDCLTVTDGAARTGKTVAAKAWCLLRPGRARYVQVPASNDDISFFRAIAEALGVSASLSMKGVQMRERVEKVLRSAKIMLVFDEAHYLWPQNNRKEALPNRLNWILTAMVNYQVPVALVTTPQFTRDQKIVEKKTGWTSAQFVGRIALYKPLPDRLNASELTAIARCHLREGDAKSISLLVDVATISQSYISGIEHAVNRARHEARKQGRAAVTFADVKSAVQNYAIPSDSALNQVLSAPDKAVRAPRPAVTAGAPAQPAALPQTSPRRSIAPEPEHAPGNRLAEHHALT